MRMVYASSALARETGFTAEDFQFPQADNPFIHRDDASRVAEFIATFVAGDAPVSTRSRIASSTVGDARTGTARSSAR